MPDTPTAPIPGLNLIGYGYDAFTSPYCDEDKRKGDKNGDPLLSGLDCGAGNNYTVSVLEGTFLCPNAIRVLGEQPKDDDYTIFADTVEQFTNQLTVKAGVSADICGFSGSVDSSYQSSTESYQEDVYAEHGHVYSGVTVQLPLSADELRSRLMPGVKDDLDRIGAPERGLSPLDIIAKYGTHLVTGVMIGGKAFLRQYSSRSDVTNSTEWQVAVKASYDGVTASASVDSKSAETRKTFKMSIDVQTLGGNGIVIGAGDPSKTSNQFQVWRDSLNGHPAIIDMTAVVPLWQLLAPGSSARAALKKAIVTDARRFQAGALIGTRQDYNNMASSGPWRQGGTTGSMAGREVGAGFGQCWSGEKGNGVLRLFLNTGQEAGEYQRLAIYGGRQTASNDTSTAAWQEISSWGARQKPSGTELEEIGIFGAYTNEGPYGQNSYSMVSLFVGPIEEAEGVCWVVRGGRSINDNGSETEEWGLSPQTNPESNLRDQKVYRAVKWNGSEWAMGSVFWYLQPVLSTLNELGGDVE